MINLLPWQQIVLESTADTWQSQIEYAKHVPQLKAHSKQKEVEQVWDLITKDPEWVVALQKLMIVSAHHLNNKVLVDAFECICLWFYKHPLTK